MRAELTGERRTAVVAEDDGAVVGYVVTMAAGDLVDLQRIAVHPARGGRASRAGCWPRSRARAPLLLEVSAGNEAALAFYAGEGFTEIHRRRRYYRRRVRRRGDGAGRPRGQ